MKYIVYESLTGLEVPIIFPDWIEHHSMVPKYGVEKVVAAGSISIGLDFKNKIEPKVSCYGYSHSLKIDSNLIGKMMISEY